MSTPILATKLYVPPPGPKLVHRPRLTAQLNDGLHRKLTLISAPAGFGKTTLVSEWVTGCERPTAWLSLDDGDNDLTRFLTYLVATLRTVAPTMGEGLLSLLQSPQPSIESFLTALVNEITTIPDRCVLIFDDYHVIDAKAVDGALAFLLDHLPPHMHLVIATREDPQLPLARLRVGDQLTELRVAELRFTPSEAAEFLNQAMELNLSAEDAAALETRTEGWIAGLQLAAISMRDHKDPTSFVKSFTGSHHFVMDYLVEEVLSHQPESVQTFLLRTSILDRLCGPLCDSVLLDSAASGQETLHYLDHANLFIVRLDDERRWYRYHHLFADLLRQRLHQRVASSSENKETDVAELHRRASQWYEDQGLDIDAFHHAAAANDVDRAERLIEGKGMPLQFRGAVTPVLNWLESLPPAVLDARPFLWVTYASALTMTGQMTAAEPKLQAAEAALQGAELDDKTRNLIGHIAAIRALLAVREYQVETIIAQSQRALAYLHRDNLAVRTATLWKLGIAYQFQGDRDAASRAYAEAVAISQASGNTVINMLATTGLGMVQESENQLHLAAQTYRSVLQLAGEMRQWMTFEAHFGLARICYEWNDLETAEQHGQQCIRLAPQTETSDRSVALDVFLARLNLAQGNVAGAATILARADEAVRRHNFVKHMAEVAAAQVATLLRQGNPTAAAELAQANDLPMSQARVHLARGETSAALATLSPLRQQMEAKRWADERLKVMVLQALALHLHGEEDRAEQQLAEALALAERGGFIRLFVDEGPPMARLLSRASAYGMMPDYIARVLAAFSAQKQTNAGQSPLRAVPASPSHIEPLSQRELEILQLVALGLSNRQIGERLFLALDTVKGHNRRIFEKLQVQRRTEAVARARELSLL